MALRIGALILASCQLFNATVISVGDLKFFSGLPYSANQPYISHTYENHEGSGSSAIATASSSSGSSSASSSASSAGKGGSSASASASSASKGGSSASSSASSAGKGGSSASSSSAASNGKSSSASSSSAASQKGASGSQAGKSWSNNDDDHSGNNDHDGHSGDNDDHEGNHGSNNDNDDHKGVSQPQVVYAKPVVVSQFVIGDSSDDDKKPHYNTNLVNVNQVPVNFAAQKYVPQSNAPVKAPINVITVPLVSTAPTVQHVVAPNYNINHSNTPLQHKDNLANELLFNYNNLSSTKIHKVVSNKVPAAKEAEPAPHIKPVTPGHLEAKAGAQLAAGNKQQNAPIVINSYVTVDKVLNQGEDHKEASHQDSKGSSNSNHHSGSWGASHSDDKGSNDSDDNGHNNSDDHEVSNTVYLGVNYSGNKGASSSASSASSASKGSSSSASSSASSSGKGSSSSASSSASSSGKGASSSASASSSSSGNWGASNDDSHGGYSSYNGNVKGYQVGYYVQGSGSGKH